MTYPERRLPFDQLTTTDERVDYVHGQLAQVQFALDKLLEREGLEPMEVMTRDVNLRMSLAPLTGNRIMKPSPLTGRIVQIIPHWPDGCNALVDMAVGHGDQIWIYPNEVGTYAALNDATPVLLVSEAVSKSEQIWMIGRNADAVNPHAISCTFVIIGVE